jgi:hypothetical protein
MRGPLSLVATLDLGGLGPHKSEPVPVEWQWYYHLPSFAGWALIGLLLVLVKENRTLQAWTILIPFLLLSEILWNWIERLLLLFMPAGAMDHTGHSLQWFLVAWTALWLISPWLARVPRLLSFVLAAAVVALIGIGAQFAVDRRVHLSLTLTDYGVLAYSLLLAIALGRMSCRKRYSPRRFLAWLVPWMIVGASVGIAGEIAATLLPQYLAGRGPPFFLLLPRLAIGCLCVAAIIYVLNLPFMILVFRVPEYRKRFENVLRLPPRACPAAVPADAIAEGVA